MYSFYLVHKCTTKERIEIITNFVKSIAKFNNLCRMYSKNIPQKRDTLENDGIYCCLFICEEWQRPLIKWLNDTIPYDKCCFQT